jgi:hypothetical protein
MVYDTPTFVVNHLRQSSLYNPTWNTQKHLIFYVDSKQIYTRNESLWFNPLFSHFFKNMLTIFMLKVFVIFIHVLHWRYARCWWHFTLHIINVEKNVSRLLFHFFFFLICVCIPWVWLGWRWCGCILMYCSSFRNFTFCFHWFLFYFRLLVYIYVVGVFSFMVFVSMFVCLFICNFTGLCIRYYESINKHTEYDNLILEQH